MPCRSRWAQGVSQPRTMAGKFGHLVRKALCFLPSFTFARNSPPLQALLVYHLMTAHTSRSTSFVTGLRSFLSVALSGGTSSRSSSLSSYEALSQVSQFETISSAPTSPDESLSGECALLIEDPEYAPLDSTKLTQDHQREDRDPKCPSVLTQHSGSLFDTPDYPDIGSLIHSETSFLLLEPVPTPILLEHTPPTHKHPVWKYESPSFHHAPKSRTEIEDNPDPMVYPDQLSSVITQPVTRGQDSHPQPVLRPTILADSPSPLSLSCSLSSTSGIIDDPEHDIRAIVLPKCDTISGGQLLEYDSPVEGFGLGISIETPLMAE